MPEESPLVSGSSKNWRMPTSWKKFSTADIFCEYDYGPWNTTLGQLLVEYSVTLEHRLRRLRGTEIGRIGGVREEN